MRAHLRTFGAGLVRNGLATAVITRLVQLDHPGFGRRVAVADGEDLHLLGTYRSAYSFAIAAIETGVKLRDLLSTDLTGVALDYGAVHSLASEWTFLPAFDHPDEPARCQVSGCGRTYGPSPTSDSPGPSWFYKGPGTVLRAHGNALEIPPFSSQCGEEAEIVAIYVIDKAGVPRRVGFAQGNEFADPALAKRDPGAFSHAKLRTCSLGPELILDADITDVPGHIEIERAGSVLWSKQFRAGESLMHYNLARVEQNLFRYPAHRRPGDAYIHYLGAAVPPFEDGSVLQDGDAVTISFNGFGKPLRNPIVRQPGHAPVAVVPL
jgi:hypothetical protein